MMRWRMRARECRGALARRDAPLPLFRFGGGLRQFSPSPPTASSLGERVGVRGLCFRVIASFKAVSSRCRGPSYFSFACPRTRRSACERRSRPEGRRAGCPKSKRSSQEKTTPRGAAFRPSMDGKSVSRGRAFRAGSCPREKALPSMATPAARPDRPRLTVAEGPWEKQRAPARRSNSTPPQPSPARRGGRHDAWRSEALRSFAPQFPDTSRGGRCRATWRRTLVQCPRHGRLVGSAD